MTPVVISGNCALYNRDRDVIQLEITGNNNTYDLILEDIRRLEDCRFIYIM